MVSETSRGRYFPLRVVTVPRDRVVHERVLHVAHDRRRRVDFADLLDRNRHHCQRAACTPELLGHLDAHEPELEVLREKLRVDLRRALHRLHARADLVVRERGDRVAEHLLVVGEYRERLVRGDGGHRSKDGSDRAPVAPAAVLET